MARKRGFPLWGSTKKKFWLCAAFLIDFNIHSRAQQPDAGKNTQHIRHILQHQLISIGDMTFWRGCCKNITDHSLSGHSRDSLGSKAHG